PHFFGGASTVASVHGAVVKYGSSSFQPFPAGLTHTCTFDKPAMPDCAFPVTGSGVFAFVLLGTCSVAANVFIGLSTSLFCVPYVSFAWYRLLSTMCVSHFTHL